MWSRKWNFEDRKEFEIFKKEEEERLEVAQQQLQKLDDEHIASEQRLQQLQQQQQQQMVSEMGQQLKKTISSLGWKLSDENGNPVV